MVKMKDNVLLALFVISVVSIISSLTIAFVGVSLRDHLQGIEDELSEKTYTKTTIIGEYGMTLHRCGEQGIFIQVGDDMRPQYSFDFTDGTWISVTVSDETNPVLPLELQPGVYNITYSTERFGGDPILLDIQEVKTDG